MAVHQGVATLGPGPHSEAVGPGSVVRFGLAHDRARQPSDGRVHPAGAEHLHAARRPAAAVPSVPAASGPGHQQ
eukprot:2998729-Lingulodinium_polyedra.AAC.1